MNCPYCGEENIDGADLCEACQQPLEFLSRRAPGSRMERCLLRHKVSRLHPRPPSVTPPDRPVALVLRQLVEESQGCALVVDDDALVGIFSERDALARLNVDATRFSQRPIAEFMTPSPETIEADAEIAFALQKMDIGGYRHLPVMSDGRIAGMISIRDILQYISTHIAVEG